ncbi:hypothetical protein DL96DRAFT_1824658 [Flagelloscypha sp. PMI_526]|nr:hypothetical protein DL96DRAFT_1824658 [Flagelloscypha sp. PMI_526]
MDLNDDSNATSPSDIGYSGMLEFEDKEGRLARLEMLLAQMDSKSENQRTRSSPFDMSPPVPNSDLLERVRTFLPELQRSNDMLVSQEAASRDLENVDISQTYIEMDLGLGVFDVKSNDIQQTSSFFSRGFDADLPSPDSCAKSFDSSSSNETSTDPSDSSDEDSDDDIIITNTAAPRLIRPLPQRRPRISVLSSTSEDCSTFSVRPEFNGRSFSA